MRSFDPNVSIIRFKHSKNSCHKNAFWKFNRVNFDRNSLAFVTPSCANDIIGIKLKRQFCRQPSGLTDELGEKYTTLIDETEDVLDVDIWLAMVTDSESDLNLEVLLESASEGYNRIVSSHVEYGTTEVSVVWNS